MMFGINPGVFPLLVENSGVLITAPSPVFNFRSRVAGPLESSQPGALASMKARVIVILPAVIVRPSGREPVVKSTDPFRASCQ